MSVSLSPAKVAQAKRLFYAAAFISLVLSVSLYFIAGDERAGIFVGLWVPSILSFGNLVLNGEQRS